MLEDHLSKKSTYELIRFISKPEKSNFGGIFGTFLALLTRWDFFSKHGLPYFSHFIATEVHAKNQKKLMGHFWDLTLRTEGRTDA